MRTALFWVITQRVVVISYRRFGSTYRSHLLITGIVLRNCTLYPGSLDYYSSSSGRISKTGPTGHPETSVRNHHYSLRNSLEECSSGVRFVNTIPVSWNNTPSCRAPRNYYPFTANCWRNFRVAQPEKPHQQKRRVMSSYTNDNVHAGLRTQEHLKLKLPQKTSIYLRIRVCMTYLRTLHQWSHRCWY